MILTAPELSSLWHPPSASFGRSVERMMARWIDAPAKAFIDTNDPRNLALGEGRRSDGTWAPIGMPYMDLRYVMHVTAPMGRGKSEWLRNLFVGLMRANAGCMMLDLKSTDLVNNCLALIPQSREGDVSILDLGGTSITGEDLRSTMNLLSPGFGQSLGLTFSLQASTVLGLFAVLDPRFNEQVGIQQFAKFGMLALLEGEPRATMMHLIRFYGDDDYRAEVLKRVRTMQVKDFWDRRFPAMPEGQKNSLPSFERRLDQLLSFPELAAMLVAPGCSIDLRKMMDNRGILLAGIRATDGQIASIAATLLLTQMTLAALSRSNTPNFELPDGTNPFRPDFTVVMDEAQIAFEDNVGMAKVIFSQLRGFRIGNVVVHQNLDQLRRIMSVLAGNAQNRVILGSENEDAGEYGTDYSVLGLTRDDFVNMPKFLHQYIKLYGMGNLFAARMLPMAKPLDEPAPPPVYVNWRTVTAPPRTGKDNEIDAAIASFRELARVRWDDAVQRLGALCQRHPDAFDAYCRRTREHREAQRQFILDHPGCITRNPDLPDEQAIVDQKERRIRTLSALGTGIPLLETQALQFGLLMAAREADERRAIREAEAEAARVAAKQAARQGNKAAPRTPAVVQGGDGAAVAGAPAHDAVALPGSGGSALPTLDQLLAERGRRRAADDMVGGGEDFL